MIVCATPAYLEKHGTPKRPEELLDHACLSLPTEYWGDERVFTGPEGEVRVRPSNVIIANNTEMLRQFALLDMGIAILPSYLIGSDATRGNLVRVLSDYRLPQVEINIGYPSRRHLPAKVRTFIDHLVEHFSRTPNGTLGELWLKDAPASAPAPTSVSAAAETSEPPLLEPVDSPEEEAFEMATEAFGARSESGGAGTLRKMPRQPRVRASTPSPL
jgi:hypothetical protein